MKNLLSKILLALLASVLIALAVVILLTRINMYRGMIEFIERQESSQLATLVPELTELYRQYGSWNFLRNSPQQWNRLLRLTRPESEPPRRQDRRHEPVGPRAGKAHLAPGGHPPPMREHVNLRKRLFLLDAQKAYVAGARLQDPDPQKLEALELDGIQVGWVGFIPVRADLPPEARRFLTGQTHTLLLSLTVAMILAAGLGFVLARHLSRPVRELAQAVRSLKQGDYAARSPISTHDEIGALGRDVNLLAETLEANRTARRRWMADVAHELRTPLSVLKGEIEALEDGVRPFDESAAASLREETEQLSRLVGDLQILALSDAGALDFRMEAVNMSELLVHQAESFKGRMSERQLVFKQQIAPGLWLEGDVQRLRQLVHNLLENACRYVEPGGRVVMALSRQGEEVLLSLDDSGPGLHENEISRLFERFYRVEESRSRDTGGSGLGLSICYNIAEAHQGSIRAVGSELGGLRFEVVFPAAGR